MLCTASSAREDGHEMADVPVRFHCNFVEHHTACYVYSFCLKHQDYWGMAVLRWNDERNGGMSDGSDTQRHSCRLPFFHL